MMEPELEQSPFVASLEEAPPVPTPPGSPFVDGDGPETVARGMEDAVELEEIVAQPWPPADGELESEVEPEDEDPTVMVFPSGESLAITTGLEGPGERYHDPNRLGNPLLATSGNERAKQLSANFTAGEFGRSGGVRFDKARISPALVSCVQAIRARLGRPVIINSGYRSHEHNERLRRANLARDPNAKYPARRSRHQSGVAVDIRTEPPLSGVEIAKAAIDACACRKENPFGDIGLGLAPRFAHVDLRGRFAVWIYAGGVTQGEVDEVRAHHARVCAERKHEASATGRLEALEDEERMEHEEALYEDDLLEGDDRLGAEDEAANLGEDEHEDEDEGEDVEDHEESAQPAEHAPIRGQWSLLEGLSAAAEAVDEDGLTDMLMFARRAELSGDDTGDALQEWHALREQVVRPSLRLAEAGAGSEGELPGMESFGGWSFPVVDPTATLITADSMRVNHLVPAARCGVRRAADGTPRVRKVADIKSVIIHVLLAQYAPTIKRWQRGDSCEPPHYVIRNDGEITQMVAEHLIAQHARKENARSIGIEHDGYTSSPSYFTEAMYVASAGLVRDICRRNGLAVDRRHIIGHDEVPYMPHGDPGGYWDWDYYMALVAWDGKDAARRPIRAVLDIGSLSGLRPSSGAWAEADRDSGQKVWQGRRRRRGPDHHHAYGDSYLWVDGSPEAAEEDAVVFAYTVPRSGPWGVAAWWPVLANNNSAASIGVETTAADPRQRTTSAIVDQRQRGIRTRKTSALPSTPVWYPVAPAPFILKAGDRVSVSVRRRSTGQGRVVADAVRFLQIL